MAVPSANAGYILSASGNDDQASVVAALTAFNLTNDPDWPVVFTQLSAKTDDSGGFNTLVSAGFSFFQDALGTVAITGVSGPNGLHSENPAYFSYSGVASLLYYTVKAGNGFDLFFYETGVINFLHSGPPAISHVTFWAGQRPQVIDDVVPEPTSMALLGMGGGLIAFGRRLRRRQTPEQAI